jgi:hypothetical protein
MRKVVGGAFLIASNAAPAKADVVYDLNFENSSNVSIGTGVLDLNLSSLSQAYNLNSFSSFKSLTTTTLDGQAITITPTNLAGGSISTGAAGQIYSLTIQETNHLLTQTALQIFCFWTSIQTIGNSTAHTTTRLVPVH